MHLSVSLGFSRVSRIGFRRMPHFLGENGLLRADFLSVAAFRGPNNCVFLSHRFRFLQALIFLIASSETRLATGRGVFGGGRLANWFPNFGRSAIFLFGLPRSSGTLRKGPFLRVFSTRRDFFQNIYMAFSRCFRERPFCKMAFSRELGRFSGRTFFGLFSFPPSFCRFPPRSKRCISEKFVIGRVYFAHHRFRKDYVGFRL